MENQDDDRRLIDTKRFKFDASLNVAHILTTIGMMVALFNWGSNVNAAIAVQAAEIQNIKMSRGQERAELMVMLAEINRKLDRLQDKKAREQ
jgi:hypothetical protein